MWIFICRLLSVRVGTPTFSLPTVLQRESRFPHRDRNGKNEKFDIGKKPGGGDERMNGPVVRKLLSGFAEVCRELWCSPVVCTYDICTYVVKYYSEALIPILLSLS